MKSLAVLFALLCVSSFAQVATGTPRYGSFSGGPDIVNNANLNIHLAVPVLSKPGRSMNFTYALGFDNSVWTKVGNAWQPVQNWGWIADTQVKTGYIQYSSSIAQCQSDTLRWYNYTVYTYDFYLDPNGVSHDISADVFVAPGQCQSLTSQPTFSVQPSDGSGLTIAGGINQTAKVTYPDGTVFTPPLNSGSGSGTATDNNGNQITVANGVYTDTIGSTALTVAGAGTPASPKTYTYTDSSGTARAITVNYQTVYVRTNFACSGVTDYGLNGSTTANLVSSITLQNGTSYSFTYEPTPGYSTYVTGRLASITLPTGGTIQYAYSGGDTSKGIYCDDGSTAYLTRTVDGNSTGYVREHVDAFSQWKTTLIYPTGDQTVIHFQKVQGSTLFVETQREVYSGTPTTGTLKAESMSCYNTCPHGKGGSGLGDAVSLPITVIDTDNHSDNGRVSGTWLSFDTVGATTQMNEYTFGSTGGSRGALIRYTMTTYSTLANGAHVPIQIKLMEPGSPDVQRSLTTYAYDGGTLTATSAAQHAAISGARGNLTSVTRWSNGAQTPDPATTYTYFDTGMVKSVTDPGGHTTNFDYTDNFTDATNHNAVAFLKTVTNHLSQVVTTNKYYWPSGAVQQTTDANSQNTSYTYDLMMRPATVNYPDLGSVTYTYTDGSNGTVQVDTLLSTGVYKTTKAKADGYGRPIRSGGNNGTNYDLVDTCYDNMGRVLAVSAPFQNSFTAAQTSCASFTDGTVYTYDALGRAGTVTAKATGLADRTMTTTYTGNSVKVEDAGNGTTTLKKLSRFDGLGRLTDTCEVSATTQQGTNNLPTDCQFDIAGSGFKTTYTYNILDHLTQVTQGGLTNRSYAYNALGQLTDATTPESGVSKFTYTNDGLAYQRIRAKANQGNACPFSPYDSAKCTTTTYTYDALHRLTQTTYDDGTTPTVTFAYDLASDAGVNFTNYVGRLGRAVVGQSKSWFSYDPVGRVLNNWQMVPPQYQFTSFQMIYTYDKAGDVLTFNNSYTTLTYAYDVLQRPTSLTGTWNNSAHPGTMFSNPTYGRFGIGSYTAGSTINSGVQTVLSYDNFGELISKSATDAGGTGTTRFSMGSMSYAPNGMLTGATVNSSGWTHAYDDLGRLFTSQNTNVSYQFNYDRYGNRVHQAVTAGNGFDVSMPTDNTTNKISTTGINYDAIGNITNDGSHGYTYDAENRIVQVDGGSTATYVYDAFSRRVQKTTAGGTLNYTYDLANNVAVVYSGTSTLSFNRAEVFLGSKHLATYTSSHTYFHHQNWLGSRATTTDETGATAQNCEWNSFGQLPQNLSGNEVCTTTTDPYALTPYGYADYERDSETRLDHLQYRYYNSRIGRFMSADLLDGSVSSPQSLNKFGYAGNSPTSAVDRFGLWTDPCPNATGELFLPSGEKFARALVAGDDLQDCPHPAGGGGGGGDLWNVGMITAAWTNYWSAANDNFSGGQGFNAAVDRAFWGANWYNLPGNANPAAEDEGRYNGQVQLGALRLTVTARIAELRNSKCEEVFDAGAGVSTDDLLSAALNTAFFPAAQQPYSNLTQDQVVGNGSSTTLGNTGYGADAVTIWGNAGNAVLFRPNFFSLNRLEQGNIVVHEMLHVTTHWSDAQIFSGFGGYGLKQRHPGTNDISAWIGTNCTTTPK